MVTKSTCKEAEADDTVENKHDGGEHGIARQRRCIRSPRKHHGNDERNFDGGHGHREHERTERLSDGMCHDFRVVYGRDDHADENDDRGNRSRQPKRFERQEDRDEAKHWERDGPHWQGMPAVARSHGGHTEKHPSAAEDLDLAGLRRAGNSGAIETITMRGIAAKGSPRRR